MTATQLAEPTLLRHTSVLEGLVGDLSSFTENYWERSVGIYRSSIDLAGLITEQEMWEEAECGLLLRPYFTCFDRGVRHSVIEMSETRHVVGHDVPGYIDLDSIREAFAAGATYKFSQPEHWHERIAELIAGLRPSFRGQTEAFVFLCPPDIVAMPAHMDGSHVFVLQVAGKKVWHVANPDETTTGLPERYRTSDIDPSRRIDFELEPGDVLYLPHGTPHYAMAKEGNSIHIAITVEEPTTRELADVVLADSLATQAAAALEGEYLRYGPSEAAERTRDVLRRFLAEGTRGAEALIEDAARLKTHVPPDPER